MTYSVLKVPLNPNQPTNMTCPHPFQGRFVICSWDLLCSTHIPILKSLWLLAMKIWKTMQNVEIVIVWFGSLKVMRNVTIRWSTCDFLINFNRNCASVFYHFWVMASYLSKVTNFNLPHLHLPSPLRANPFDFCRDFPKGKTRVPIVCRVALFA